MYTGSGKDPKLYDQGNKTKRWDSDLDYVEVPDSKGAKTTRWVRLRLVSPWIKEAAVWLTSKGGKQFPLTDPDWDVASSDFRKPSKDGSPLRFQQWCRIVKNPKTDEDEVEQVRGGSISCKVNVIDRAAQRAGDDRIVKVWRFSASSLTALREVADGQNGANAFDPTLGYDIKVRYNSELKGAAAIKIEAVSASPLTDEELALVYGVYAVKVSAENVAAIRKKDAGAVKTLLGAGFKKKEDASLFARMNGYAVSQVLRVESSLEGEQYAAKTRKLKFSVAGVPVAVKAVSEGQAYDLEAMWFPTSPEEVLRSLKTNNYFIEGEEPSKRRRNSDDDDDDRPKSRRRARDEDDDDDDRPKSRRRARDEDEDDDDSPKSIRRSRDEDEDEDEDDRPKSRRHAPADDDDEDESPKSRRKSKPVVTADEDDDDDDDDDDPKPVSRSKSGSGKKAKPADEDDEGDEEDDPPPKSKTRPKLASTVSRLKSRR